MDSTGSKQYRRQFPSRFYEEENHLYKSYLPHQVKITPGILGKTFDFAKDPEMGDVEYLIANCVLMDIPER